MQQMRFGDYKVRNDIFINIKKQTSMNNHEESQLDKLSLSETEELLTQEMDELIGGDYILYCSFSGENAHAM